MSTDIGHKEWNGTSGNAKFGVRCLFYFVEQHMCQSVKIGYLSIIALYGLFELVNGNSHESGVF